MVDLFSTQLSLASYTFPELQGPCRRSFVDCSHHDIHVAEKLMSWGKPAIAHSLMKML